MPDSTHTHLYTLLLANMTDQPGRVLAVLVFAPLIMYKGVKYRDAFLIAFAIILFVWDLYWLVFKAPSTITQIAKN